MGIGVYRTERQLPVRWRQPGPNFGRSRIIAAENMYDVSFTLSPSTRQLITANGVPMANLSDTTAHAQTITTFRGQSRTRRLVGALPVVRHMALDCI